MTPVASPSPGRGPAPWSTRATLRLTTPAQVAAAVPFLIGFHPSESVVALGLASERREICLTMRVDLSRRRHAPQLAAVVAAHLRHAGAGAAFLLVVSEDRQARPHPALVTALRSACDEQALEVRDVLWLRSGRWGSYLCGRARCCPVGGSPVDSRQVANLAALSALQGEVIHDSRESLERSLAPVAGRDRSDLDRTFERVGPALLSELAEFGRVSVAADSRRLLEQVVLARVDRVTELAPKQLARLALGLGDVSVRDAALCWIGTDLEHAAESLWVELTRRATPPYDAPAATLLAVHAYLRGNGGYARMALDRALAGDPDYSFARLLAGGLDRGVPPSTLREAVLATGGAV